MDCVSILKNLDVLYIEDENQIRQMMKEVLQEDFHSFDTAADGKEGLGKFQQKHFDCVVTDIEMEGMDGLTLAQKIKEIDEDVVVILLTAYSEKERLFKAIDIGVNKYLVKPFTPEKLLQAICDIFSKKLAKEHIVDFGNGYLYNPQTAQVKKEDEVIKLTKKEKLFLDLLLENRDHIVSFQEIETHVWEEGEFSENALRTLVKRLRKKLFKELIVNYSGLGYKINLN
ncbi:hypothetical protein NitYY0826_C1833 [Nitratiruptor sp. YY08-26]|uniref:response regulator transcription factor n=1 Tax=unclassified Nitratiruptor TaxID=2624044 RepID=UPI0019157A9E|nr:MULTISPECIES: response regulator transcription factor [unclassified Nitratiruptor]BCD62945.1 hypothetical protein NitYY0813_C1831 [Nitratiruptor sp. YY08-13]BCD66880.1 hypothetical protein NitYY0826_C1833 [Nitratiruptor sp. YY08-26]